VIEPATPLPGEPPPAAEAGSAERLEPILLEDLVAAVRLPAFFRKIDAVLDRALAEFDLPSDSPFLRESARPGDGVTEYGLRWSDREGLLRVFLGMSWLEQGHDPAWEVRVEARAESVARALRVRRWHQLCARRAESRFTEWDRFWQEDEPKELILLGASAAVTRFFEDEEPEGSASEYLGGAFYALHASGALHALLQAAREIARGGGGAAESAGEEGAGAR
jgi:hypothetical protein